MKLVRATLADTSPASATTAVGALAAGGFRDTQSLTVIASIRGGTGGTLDVYLQTSFDSGATWLDYAHFAQLASGAALTTRVWHMHRSTAVSTIATIGSGTSPALAANAINGGAWGEQFRLLYVAGVSTSSGGAQSVTLIGYS